MAQLPFLYDAELKGLGDKLLDRLSCSVWPAERQRDENVGEAFDHSGEAPYTARESLTAQENLTLVVKNGPHAGSYRIVGATPQPFTGHVGLELTKMMPVG